MTQKNPECIDAITEGSGEMITHVMSDGTRRKSIEGMVVPAEHPAYKVIQKMEEEGRMVKKNESASQTKTA